jgi:hypothetical protein
MGACPGNEESAGVNHGHRVPKSKRRLARMASGDRFAREQHGGYQLDDQAGRRR